MPLVLCREGQHSQIGRRPRRKGVSFRATGAFPVDHVPAAPRFDKVARRHGELSGSIGVIEAFTSIEA
jgi:hypothetical protein